MRPRNSKFAGGASGGVRLHHAIAAATRQLYCDQPDLYRQYRASRSNASEDDAWRHVGAFVRERGLKEHPVIDLGCGFGPPEDQAWAPSAYLGVDLSKQLLAQHLHRGMPTALLLEADLNAPPSLLFEWRRNCPRLVLAVLSLHYLRDVSLLLDRLAATGSWFCLVVANAASDQGFANGGIVCRNQGILSFSYYLRSLSDYVSWLGSPEEIWIKQCGDERDDAGRQPYYLIGGRW